LVIYTKFNKIILYIEKSYNLITISKDKYMKEFPVYILEHSDGSSYTNFLKEYIKSFDKLRMSGLEVFWTKLLHFLNQASATLHINIPC